MVVQHTPTNHSTAAFVWLHLPLIQSGVTAKSPDHPIHSITAPSSSHFLFTTLFSFPCTLCVSLSSHVILQILRTQSHSGQCSTYQSPANADSAPCDTDTGNGFTVPRCSHKPQPIIIPGHSASRFRWTYQLISSMHTECTFDSHLLPASSWLRGDRICREK